MSKAEPHKGEVKGPCGHYGVVLAEIEKSNGAYTGYLRCPECGIYQREAVPEQMPEILRGPLDERGRLAENDLKKLDVSLFSVAWK